MEEILRQFDPITLDEMSGIRLMNRTDTKFVTTRPMLEKLLMMARDDYFAQDIDGSRIASTRRATPTDRSCGCAPTSTPT